MRHSTPFYLIQNWKILQKMQISDNLTEKIDAQTNISIQSQGVSWGPGVFDASLLADVCDPCLSLALETGLF